MPHIPPEDVISPKAYWSLVDVIIDNGANGCAYAIGMWERKRRIGFRWNGNDESPLGSPQSRGLPMWMILDPALNTAILKLVEKQRPDKVDIVRAFFAKKIES